MLQEQLQQVRERISHACQRCGRDPSSVTLIGVTKTVPADVVGEAIQLGLTDLGENRVQEAQAKRQALGFTLHASGSSVQPVACSLQPVHWHLIGHLQRNKVKLALELFDVIHSVDSLALVHELERCAIAQLPAPPARRSQEPGRAGSGLQDSGAMKTPIKVLVQVNISGETTKYGCQRQDAHVLAQAILRCSSLKLCGLMTIAPFSENPEVVRPYFRRLRELRDEMAAACSLQPAALCLSMGMSGDFEVAIEEGANFVRIGTAIFGARGEGRGARGERT